MRLAPQRNGAGERIKADVHNRAVGERRVKRIRILAVQVTRVARRILAVVKQHFAKRAHFWQRLLQRDEIRQAGGFKRLEQHHLIFTRAGDRRFHFAQVRGQRLFANHMLFMVHKQAGLGKVQGVGACDIDRVDGVALRQRLQRREEMLHRVVARERLRLFKAAGVDRGQGKFARLVGGIDKLARYPVRSNNGETYHKGVSSPTVNIFSE